MSKKELLIIIPAYNEAGTIGNLLDKLEQPEIADIADVLVINDASVDGTQYICLNRGHKVATHPFNLGYGSGLQTGYKYAVRRGYEYVIQLDADGQHDACNIAQIFEKLKTTDDKGNCPDIVIGSRFVEGATSFPIPAAKKFAISFFRRMIKSSTGKIITDPTSGLQGLNKRTIWYYSRFSHFDDKYPDANMLMQMLLLGYRVEEVPAVMHARTEGKSMHSGIIKPAIYMIRMMFCIFAVWMRVRLFNVDKESINGYEQIKKLQNNEV